MLHHQKKKKVQGKANKGLSEGHGVLVCWDVTTCSCAGWPCGRRIRGDASASMLLQLSSALGSCWAELSAALLSMLEPAAPLSRPKMLVSDIPPDIVCCTPRCSAHALLPAGMAAASAISSGSKAVVCRLVRASC